MGSINFVKGYGKVNGNHLEVEDQAPKPHPKTHRKRLVVISAVVLLSLLIALLLGALIHESTTESPESPSLSSSANSTESPSLSSSANSTESPSLSSSANSTESILRTVCNVTRFPTSCFSSISTFNGSQESDPEAIFKLSLRVSIAELLNLSSSLNAINSKEAALRDCKGQIEDALSQLNDSVSAMEVVAPGEKMLTETKISDIQTWISGAMTDQETCLDGLEEMESTVLGEVKKKMQKSKECISNSLAIVANFHTILDNLHNSLH